MNEDARAQVSARYARFARAEAPGRSALYADWAAGIAADGNVPGDPAIGILARIRPTHRQPPLVFAVTRMLGAPEQGYPVWKAWLLDHDEAVIAECERRTLQTNDPLRCAALLAALAEIRGPIALLEVGASAGLCLYPDAYSYRYRGGSNLDPATGSSAVVLHSRWLSGPVPQALPEVAWRAGIDLNPLDAADPDHRRFLTALVWPGETGREARITAALDHVRGARPQIVAADATEPEQLRALAEQAPKAATLVITTPGVLPHIPAAGRERLLQTISELDATWVSIDPPGVHQRWPNQPATGYALGRDRRALAAVDPLGGSVAWL